MCLGLPMTIVETNGLSALCERRGERRQVSVMLLDQNVAVGNVVASTAILCVVLSAFAHGLSAPPLVGAYSSWWNKRASSGAEAIEAEKVAVHAPRGLGAAHE